MSEKLEQIFLYGTLRYAPLLNVVAGEPVSGKAAVLKDHSISTADGQNFPLVRVDPGQVAPGIVVRVSADAMRRMDFYEMGFGYQPALVEVDVGGKKEPALVYLPEADLWSAGGPWSLDDWMATHGPLTAEAANEYMDLERKLAPTEAAALFPQIRSRAASRLRARSTARERSLGDLPSLQDLNVHETRRPYVNFFAVQEDDLSFPKFDGGHSPVVSRAAFVGGDAVTVLPYDPVSDEILLIRQFRYGAYVRGDRQPWCAEPIAGRIDPGETPEEAARREALEEAGLEVTKLYPVARYYPSPGVLSEFLFSFVAPVDLSGVDRRVQGVETEAEDIQSRVISLDHLMQMIATGEADTGPLVLTAYWLAANRDRLRASH